MTDPDPTFPPGPPADADPRPSDAEVADWLGLVADTVDLGEGGLRRQQPVGVASEGGGPRGGAF